MDEKKLTPRKRSLAGKIAVITLKVIGSLVLLVAVVALLILTPPVQNFIKSKATAWLSKKLDTKVAIGRIYIGFPKKVVIEDLYVEDKKKDTLLAGGALKVDISMLKLLDNEVEVSQVELEKITAKVKRVLPDTAYNFQFIIDAFASGDTTAAKPADTSSMKISVKGVELDKIRLVYDDAITGNDMTVWLEHFDTDIDEFDLAKMRFSVPETNISGIRANIYQHTPLVIPDAPIVDSFEKAEPGTVDFSFDEFNLKDIKLDYGNDVSKMSTQLDLGKLTIGADKVDLQKQEIKLDEITLDNTTAAIRFGKLTEAAKGNPANGTNTTGNAARDNDGKNPKGIATNGNGNNLTNAKENPNDTTIAEANGWRLLVKSIRLNNNNLAFSNDNEPTLKQGMDYAHIDAKNLNFHVDNLRYSPDSMSAQIIKGELLEKSGFQLKTLQTEFSYAATGAYLHNLLLETPGTTIRRSATVSYPSLETLKKDIGQLQMNIDLTNSKIQIKDILTFVPTLASQPAFANPSSMLYVDGNITGRVANMNINRLNLRAFSNTVVNVRGRISGLPDAKKVNGNLVINNITTNRKDIQLLAPKGSLPKNITLPSSIKLNGTVAGGMSAAKADLQLNTDLGGVSLKGNVSNPTDSVRAKYNATVVARQLQLGRIMQNDSMYGPLSATVKATGTGYAAKTVDAKLNAAVSSAVLNRYNYKDVKLDGAIANQQGTVQLNIKDPNISIALSAAADISKEFPAIKLDGQIDTINVRALNFVTDTLSYSGNIAADFPNTDPANLVGKLFVTKSVLYTNGQHYALDTISVVSGHNEKGKFLNLDAMGISAALSGQYNLAQLGSVITQTIQPYYTIDTSSVKDTLDAYDFNFTAQVLNTPTLKAFVPALSSFDPINIKGRFATGEGFKTNLDAPFIQMGTNRIQQLKLDAGTAENAIKLNLALQQFSAGGSLNIFETSLGASIANNKINFLLNLKDQDSKNKYRLGGRFEQPQTGIYALALDPGELLLNYDKWNLADNNLISLNNGDIHITDFLLSKGGQQLSLNSTEPGANSPLEVRFGNFRIGTLTAFAKQDTALADGVINGNVLVKNIPTQPTFTSDLTITDLMFRKDTVGNLAMKVSNTTANVYVADITLTGKGNDIAIGGDYTVKPANQSAINLNMDIRKLTMASVQAFSMGSITRGTGYLTGKFAVQGTPAQPDVDGNITFNQAGFSPAMLGSFFTIDKESIVVNNEGIHFDSFSILDSSKNEMNLDGWAYTSNFSNYKLDLDLTADNFQALNSTKQDSKLFYGKFFFDTDLHIGGTETSPKVDGSLKVNDKTNMTIVLPTADPGLVDREGIVRFIDADSISTDTLVALAAQDSLSKSDITGMDVSVNIETSKDALFTLVIDEGNGDFLSVKGTAQLTGGIDPSGKTTLAGNYEIDEGAYQLTIQVLKRRFEIQKGSRITWLGEPTKADLDLTAIYVANTAPITLVQEQVTPQDQNQYKQKLPFNVNLMLTGEMLKPNINFDVALPDRDSAQYTVSEKVEALVTARLNQLRSQPSELNKQVFALLLLNRFVAENPFASGTDGANAGTIARQSVSRLLNDQLNNLAADLIKGVDVNFDLASTEDYTTGSRQKRTDLNVSLSKQLLNDRLKVTVGNNFELEGPSGGASRGNSLAGNVALDYMLSKDGRYMIRGYRKNQYEGELDGYVIETGLNFILTFDYDKLRELFHSPKPKRLNNKKKNPTI